MQILRGRQLSTKLLAFLLLVLSAATSLAIITPQSTQAKGSLFSTVRCTVRTVLHRECVKKEKPVNKGQAQGKQGNSSAGGQPGATPAPKPDSSSEQPEAMVLTPLEVPEAVSTDFKEVALPKVEVVPGAARSLTASPADAAASLKLFNAQNSYAVAGAHTAASNATAVQRSAEGWKFFGIAWYWWVITGVVIAGVARALFVTGRRLFSAATRQADYKACQSSQKVLK